MAKILAKANRSSLVTPYKSDDPEYSKYESVNVSKRKGIIRPSSEVGVRIRGDANKPRPLKTPTHTNHDFCLAKLSATDGDNPVLVKRPASSSSRKYEESSKKLVQFRKCKTDLKILPDKQRPQTVQGLTRKPDSKEISKEKTNNHPLKEVRRKLHFGNVDQDDVNDNDTEPFDFTDKLVAIRNVIDKTRDSRDILDRRAYYDEYKSSQRRIIVSRSDSFKENVVGGDSDITNVNEEEANAKDTKRDERNSRGRSQDRKERPKDKRTRDVKSADIFKPRNVDGRLSVDINKLRSNLEERRDCTKDSANQPYVANTDPRVSPISQTNNSYAGDDMLHAKSNRKILTCSVKSKHEAKSRRNFESDQNMGGDAQINESYTNDKGENRSLKRKESRETQTNLNHSVRSVQSNVPFYDSKHFIDDLNRENNKSSGRKTPCEVQDNVLCDIGFENDIGRLSSGKANCFEEKQTNVGDFFGIGLNQEKDRLKYNHKEVDKDLEHLRSKLSWLMGRDVDNHKKRPKSRSKVHQNDDVFNGKETKETDEDRKGHFDRLANHLLADGENRTERPDVADQKVRDWIKSQQVLNAGYLGDQKNVEALVIEELSVSVSIKNKRDVADENVTTNSSSDTCDKYPVKLEKVATSKMGAKPNDNKTSKRTIGSELVGEGFLPEDPRNLHGNIDEVPVRDYPGTFLPARQGLPDSDSYETESSVLSLPFSSRSGESISSTIQAVKLLRKLYHVDPDTRQNLVLMARCFRRWLNNVLYAKARNAQITQAAQRVSPISYGMMIRKGEICYRTSLLSQYFARWKDQLQEARVKKAVEALQRKHLLQKGMNAFRWSINRSKLRQGILQDRISTILLASGFKKWKYRTIENRRLRMQQAFLRWRQFTKEAQKIRTLRHLNNMKLKDKLFKTWCEKYATRVKQHKADAKYRSILLSHSWLSWKLFTVTTQEKKKRHTLAIQLYESTLQKKIFLQMKVEFSKYKKADEKLRISQLKLAIVAWKQGTQLSKLEREDNGRVAEVCWVRTKVRTAFTAWREALLTKRAVRMFNAVTIKKTFRLWSDQYKFLVQRRENIDMYVHTKSLAKVFTKWSVFVQEMKQRRQAAIDCIHIVLQRKILERWIGYTRFKRDLRRRYQLYVRKTKLETQQKYLDLWRSKFKVKCDKQRAQQLWSIACTRKAADHWKMVCHRRKLVRLQRDHEPVRVLTTQRVFFIKWLAQLQKIENEKQEAAEARLVLDQSLLRKCFDKWHSASQKLVLIKPMVLQYRRSLLIQCFESWQNYVKHKAQCCQSYNKTITVRLRHKFAAWSRQYSVHQIEKEYSKTLLRRQASQCLQAWKTVIQRKHTAKQFYEHHLLKSSFYLWNMLAVRQIRQKRLVSMEQESIANTLRTYFERWRDRMHRQQTVSENGIIYIQQLQESNQLRAMFTFWRRHFRATLIARENEKLRTRKLAKVALQEWHRFTQNSLQEAVCRFAAAIGLHHSGEGDTGSLLEHIDVSDRYISGENEMMLDAEFEPLNFDSESPHELVHSPRTPRSPHTPRTPRTPKTPRTPHTPRQGSVYGTPLKRLFSPQSRQSLAQSHDFEIGPLLSSSFLDARFEMEHAVKTESRREIVITAVTRLQHWPLSNIFDQWKEYTARQVEFKHLTTQMKSVQEKLDQSLFFRCWLTQYRNTQIAKQHYDQVLEHKALLSLILYRNCRKQKKQLKWVANQHFARKVYTVMFPLWLQKTQDKLHTEHILHLWANITAEEQQLIPRERSFKYKLNRKMLHNCFNTWCTLSRKVEKLKKIYHKILLQRCFTSWSRWALEKHSQKVKCEAFKNKRIKTMVFQRWCLRYRQKTEVARRYNNTWHNYQGTIFQAWFRWAQDQRKRKLLAYKVIKNRNKHLVTEMFVVWKASTEKQIKVQKWFETRLSQRAIVAWHQVAMLQKDLRNTMVQCHLMSSRILVRQAFQHWYSCYCRRLENRKLHEHMMEKRLLRIALKWKRKAQKTRGIWLRQKLEQRLVQRSLEKWKMAYNQQQQRLDVLDQYVMEKNRHLLSQCLSVWRTELMALQVQGVFNMRLMVTLVESWKLTARVCKQRRQALLTYQTEKQARTQKGYFLYWYNVAMARKSIRGHANLKMQLSVFKAWLLYTRKQNNLRRLETTFTKRSNQQTLQKYWYVIKTRFHYCIELKDISNRVIQEKNNKIMKRALDHWNFRLQTVIAYEFHEHLLAKRVATQWRRFVLKRKQERRHMQELLMKAKDFHIRKLCKTVYTAWRNEVLATRQNNKRKVRLAEKYARLWKHRVDLAYTATCMREERLYLMVWKKWHLEYVKKKAEHKMVAFEKKQKLSMIFISWRNLCRKKARRLSMIPLPVSPAFNMPVATRSSNSTPTDEVFSPPPSTAFAKPSQIPLPSSSSAWSKGTLSGTNGRSTQTSQNGRSTPTMAGRRSSFLL